MISLSSPIHQRWTPCAHCALPVRKSAVVVDSNVVIVGGEVQYVYVDETGGDVCCADKFMERNENGTHILGS